MYLIIADRCFSLAVVKIEHVVIVVIALDAAKFMSRRVIIIMFFLNIILENSFPAKKVVCFCSLENQVLSKCC